MLARTLVAFVLALCAAPAMAEYGTIDEAPAATLLFPHFEVNPNSSTGLNTILTVQNTSATATVAKVVLWTDYGIPTASFTLYLTGYDTETLNMREVLYRQAPITADDADDPSDTISPQGPISQDINFPGTNNVLPAGIIPAGQLISAHRGLASVDYFGGLCGARNYNDGIARGYVTMDTVNNQTARRPTDPSYFTNDITFQNILEGSYLVLDAPRGRVYADNAVAIEARDFSVVIPPGTPTFYRSFNGGNTSDRREALPTAWTGRFASDRTDLSVWREPSGTTVPFACAGAPIGVPSTQRALSGLNADGTVAGSPAGNFFPIVSGNVAGSTFALNIPLGSLFTNLNPSAGVIRQSWVNFRQIPSAAATNGRIGYSAPGIQLGNAVNNDDPSARGN